MQIPIGKSSNFYSSLPRTSLTADERCGEAGVFACLSSYSYHISLSSFTSSFPRLGFVLIYFSCVRVNSEHLLSNNFPLFSHPIRLLFVTFQVVAINIRTMTLLSVFPACLVPCSGVTSPTSLLLSLSLLDIYPSGQSSVTLISLIFTAWLLPFSFLVRFLEESVRCTVLYCIVGSYLILVFEYRW